MSDSEPTFALEVKDDEHGVVRYQREDVRCVSLNRGRVAVEFVSPDGDGPVRRYDAEDVLKMVLPLDR